MKQTLRIIASFIWIKIRLGGEENLLEDILTNYLRPGELVLYTAKNRNELMKEYRLIPDPNGDVKIYRAFWKTNEAVRTNTVHPVLVYADLMNTGNSRCIETAQMVWDKYLTHEF